MDNGRTTNIKMRNVYRSESHDAIDRKICNIYALMFATKFKNGRAPFLSIVSNMKVSSTKAIVQEGQLNEADMTSHGVAIVRESLAKGINEGIVRKEFHYGDYILKMNVNINAQRRLSTGQNNGEQNFKFKIVCSVDKMTEMNRSNV